MFSKEIAAIFKRAQEKAQSYFTSGPFQVNEGLSIQLNDSDWQFTYTQNQEYILRKSGPHGLNLDNDKNPSIVRIVNGLIFDLTFFKDNRTHRKNGPAIIKFEYGVPLAKIDQYLSTSLKKCVGPVKSLHFYKDGRPLRQNGPTVIDTNGEKEFYLNYKRTTKEEYNRSLRKKEIQKKLKKVI